MQHSRADLFGLTDVPEVFAEITAGTTSNIHLCVVFIVTSGAFPFAVAVDNDLTVKATLVTVVTLCIELCVLNIVIDKLDYLSKSRKVVSHVGDLNVGDSTAGGDILELALKAELFKRVNLLTNVNVVGVSVVSLIGNVGDRTESLLVYSCETVAK